MAVTRRATAISRASMMTNDEQKLLNELLNDDSDKMSEWEQDFLESLDSNRAVELTGKQSDKLNQIWNRVFP